MIVSYLLKLIAVSCEEEIANMNEPTYNQAILVKSNFESWWQRLKESGKSESKLSESDQEMIIIQIKLYLKCKYTQPEVFI